MSNDPNDIVRVRSNADWERLLIRYTVPDFVPGLHPSPPCPRLSSLTRTQHEQCVTVLCHGNRHVLPDMVVRRPTAQDYAVFEEVREVYLQEQREYIKWAKSLWENGQYIRALEPSPATDIVYLAEHNVRINLLRGYPMKYDGSIILSLDTGGKFGMRCKEIYQDVNVANLPQLRFPEPSNDRGFTLRPTDATLKPCTVHPTRFILPGQRSATKLMAPELHMELAEYAAARGVPFVARESALRCLVESRYWVIVVSVCPVRWRDGKLRKVVVLGNEVTYKSECPMLRTFRAYKRLLENAVVLPAQLSKWALYPDHSDEEASNEATSANTGNISWEERYVPNNKYGDHKLFIFGMDKPFEDGADKENENPYAETSAEETYEEEMETLVTHEFEEEIPEDEDQYLLSGLQSSAEESSEDEMESLDGSPLPPLSPDPPLVREEQPDAEIENENPAGVDENMITSTRMADEKNNGPKDPDAVKKNGEQGAAGYNAAGGGAPQFTYGGVAGEKNNGPEDPDAAEKNGEQGAAGYNATGGSAPECTCKDTVYGQPPPRSFKKWRLRSTYSSDNVQTLDVIVHCSHKYRGAKGEILLEPIIEYQAELGACVQPEDRVKSTALALALRDDNTGVVNVRIDMQTGDVMSIEELAGDQLKYLKSPAALGDGGNIIHSILNRLQVYEPGHYLLVHDSIDGEYSILYAEGSCYDQPKENASTSDADYPSDADPASPSDLSTTSDEQCHDEGLSGDADCSGDEDLSSDAVNSYEALLSNILGIPDAVGLSQDADADCSLDENEEWPLELIAKSSRDVGTDWSREAIAESSRDAGTDWSHEVNADCPRDADVASSVDVNAEVPRDKDGDWFREASADFFRDADAACSLEAVAGGLLDADADKSREANAIRSHVADEDCFRDADLDCFSDPNADCTRDTEWKFIEEDKPAWWRRIGYSRSVGLCNDLGFPHPDLWRIASLLDAPLHDAFTHNTVSTPIASTHNAASTPAASTPTAASTRDTASSRDAASTLDAASTRNTGSTANASHTRNVASTSNAGPKVTAAHTRNTASKRNAASSRSTVSARNAASTRNTLSTPNAANTRNVVSTPTAASTRDTASSHDAASTLDAASTRNTGSTPNAAHTRNVASTSNAGPKVTAAHKRKTASKRNAASSRSTVSARNAASSRKTASSRNAASSREAVSSSDEGDERDAGASRYTGAPRNLESTMTLKTPVLGPILLPYHKVQGLLPCAFSFNKENVIEDRQQPVPPENEPRNPNEWTKKKGGKKNLRPH